LSADAVAARVAALDSHGLLVDDHPQRDAYKRELAWPAALAARHALGDPDQRGLEAVVRAIRPTVLVGTSGQPRCFTESIVRTMAEYCERPVILPFSNPTDQSEADPADLLRWTDGRALVATGSPFAPVTFGGRQIRIGQGNTVLVFPGIGLGALLAGAPRISDEMLSAAARTLAGMVTESELASGMLFPAVGRLRDVSCAVAAAVIRVVRGEPYDCPASPALLAEVQAAMWVPRYSDYVAPNVDDAHD
jgi:malic enzyme